MRGGFANRREQRIVQTQVSGPIEVPRAMAGRPGEPALDKPQVRSFSESATREMQTVARQVPDAFRFSIQYQPRTAPIAEVKRPPGQESIIGVGKTMGTELDEAHAVSQRSGEAVEEARRVARIFSGD